MKLEAAKHVEAVGAMKLEDKELTGGCNGESEEEDSNRHEIAEAVKVAMSSMSSCCEIAESVGSSMSSCSLLGRRCRRRRCRGRAQPWSNGKEGRLRRSPIEVESKGRSAVEKNGMRAKEEVKKLGHNP
ncbi:hypothetical protein LXL04_015716 [Taraxacum kok-saghyz]